MPPDPVQVYVPAEDTFLLLDAARQEVRGADRVLEVGTGSGLIAAALKKTARCVIATDINPHAAACARSERIDIVITDLCAGLCTRFDLIVFNPPYLPTRKDERIDDWLEHTLDGGESGRDVIARFLADAGRVLAPGGRILLLISSLTGLDEVIDMALAFGLSVMVVREQVVEDEMLYVLRLVRKTD
jgi:release factor glutamine methyltransferase